MLEQEILHVRADFPPVTTEEWEAAIAKDLKGADYEKKLVWRTEEGLAVRPYYRASEAQYPAVPPKGGAAAPNAIRADLLHEAGAHAVQELGYALAAGVEKLAEVQDGSQIEFVFAAGPYYFIEIAKFRAARLLWAQAVAAFGLSAAPMRIVVRTPRRNKSVYDRYTNLLRATTEALSGVIGGADAVTVEPFGFEPHTALNVERLIREESHIDAVEDPAAGSYFIEAVTDALGREAWKLFQQVEAAGGYSKALASGAIDAALAQSRAARDKALSSRRRALVGVNNFPNTMEKTPETDAPALFESALPQIRLAEPFEKLRQHTIDHAAATGRYPKVLLLKRGDVKMKGARATFCLNFFGCAGFDIVESDELADDADLVVLCSSDPEYLALAQEVCAQVKVPVIVAGYPKEQIEALQAAGVGGFVHMQSDAIETLTLWQDRLGMRSSQ